MIAHLRSLLRLFGIAVYRLGLARVLLRRSPHRARVLLYHAVEEQEGVWIRGLRSNTRPGTFAAHLDLLDRLYDVVPLDRILRPGDATGRPRVAITFDDGYRSMIQHALPLLRSRGHTATAFLVTGVIGNERFVWVNELALLLDRAPAQTLDVVRRVLGVPSSMEESGAVIRHVQTHAALDRIEGALAEIRGTLSPDARPSAASLALYVTAQDLEEWRNAGCGIGSHTTRHPNLRTEDAPRRREELANALRSVTELGGVPALAYPFGEVDDTVRADARAVGYRFLLEVGGVNPARGIDPSRIARVPVDDYDEAALFAELEVTEPLVSAVKRVFRPGPAR